MNGSRSDTFFQQFRHWDLNLLVVLEALFTEQGNVTRAAQRVGLSQSAMSHALNRLREMLGDPLFVKQGQRMQATARTVALAPQVSAWLEQIRQQLNPPQFDPATIRQEVNIAIHEHLERLILPSLLGVLRRQAPGIHLHSRPVPMALLTEAFAQGRVEMAIIGGDWELSEAFRQQLLTESRFVYIYHAEQLTLNEPVSLAELAAVPQLASNYSHKTATIIDNHFTAHGLSRPIMATAGGITAIPAILRECPMLAILPEIMVVDHPLFDGLVMRPFEPEQVRAELYLIWHRLHEHDPVQQFIRERIIQHFADRNTVSPALPA